MEQRTVTRNVRIPENLYAWLMRRAKENRRSINKELQVVLEESNAMDASLGYYPEKQEQPHAVTG